MVPGSRGGQSRGRWDGPTARGYTEDSWLLRLGTLVGCSLLFFALHPPSPVNCVGPKPAFIHLFLSFIQSTNIYSSRNRHLPSLCSL